MKRSLTTEEIETLLSKIDQEVCQYNIPKATQNATNTLIKNNLRDQLKKIKIFPLGIPRLEREMINYYHTSQIQPGASVGIVTAQSIGERQTQMTLNTFHSAGMAIATVITGVPRFGELLNATTNPKLVSCQIYFEENDQELETLRQYIGSDLRQFMLKDLTASHTIEYGKASEPWFSTYLMFNDTSVSVDELCGAQSDYVCISFILNPSIIYEYIISLQSVAEKLTDEYDDIIVIASPYEKHRIDVFVDITQITADTAEIMDAKVARQLYIDNVVIPALFDIIVCGIPGIKNFFFKRFGADDKLMKTCENFTGKSGWMVETQGSNYAKLLGHVKLRTAILISNNMWDIYGSLGIEAARQFLIDEFMNVVSSDGTYINICHVMLLVDIMTFSGTISSVSRYGIKRAQAGPLAKASFEESLDNFLKAGVFGDIETTNGVSASIMCGKRSKIGTGLCDLLYYIEGQGSDYGTSAISTDPVKETLFTDLSKWLDAVASPAVTEESVDYDTESNDLSDALSDASEQDVLQPDTPESDNDDRSASDVDDQSIEDTSDSVDDSGEGIGDDLIFDDNQMDDFMEMV